MAQPFAMCDDSLGPSQLVQDPVFVHDFLNPLRENERGASNLSVILHTQPTWAFGGRGMPGLVQLIAEYVCAFSGPHQLHGISITRCSVPNKKVDENVLDNRLRDSQFEQENSRVASTSSMSIEYEDLLRTKEPERIDTWDDGHVEMFLEPEKIMTRFINMSAMQASSLMIRIGNVMLPHWGNSILLVGPDCLVAPLPENGRMATLHSYGVLPAHPPALTPASRKLRMLDTSTQQAQIAREIQLLQESKKAISIQRENSIKTGNTDALFYQDVYIGEVTYKALPTLVGLSSHLRGHGTVEQEPMVSWIRSAQLSWNRLCQGRRLTSQINELKQLNEKKEPVKVLPPEVKEEIRQLKEEVNRYQKKITPRDLPIQIQTKLNNLTQENKRLKKELDATLKTLKNIMRDRNRINHLYRMSDAAHEELAKRIDSLQMENFELRETMEMMIDRQAALQQIGAQHPTRLPTFQHNSPSRKASVDKIELEEKDADADLEMTDGTLIEPIRPVGVSINLGSDTRPEIYPHKRSRVPEDDDRQDHGPSSYRPSRANSRSSSPYRRPSETNQGEVLSRYPSYKSVRNSTSHTDNRGRSNYQVGGASGSTTRPSHTRRKSSSGSPDPRFESISASPKRSQSPFAHEHSIEQGQINELQVSIVSLTDLVQTLTTELVELEQLPTKLKQARSRPDLMVEVPDLRQDGDELSGRSSRNLQKLTRSRSDLSVSLQKLTRSRSDLSVSSRTTDRHNDGNTSHKWNGVVELLPKRSHRHSRSGPDLMIDHTLHEREKDHVHENKSTLDGKVCSQTSLNTVKGLKKSKTVESLLPKQKHRTTSTPYAKVASRVRGFKNDPNYWTTGRGASVTSPGTRWKKVIPKATVSPVQDESHVPLDSFEKDPGSKLSEENGLEAHLDVKHAQPSGALEISGNVSENLPSVVITPSKTDHDLAPTLDQQTHLTEHIQNVDVSAENNGTHTTSCNKPKEDPVKNTQTNGKNESEDTRCIDRIEVQTDLGKKKGLQHKSEDLRRKDRTELDPGKRKENKSESNSRKESKESVCSHIDLTKSLLKKMLREDAIASHKSDKKDEKECSESSEIVKKLGSVVPVKGVSSPFLTSKPSTPVVKKEKSSTNTSTDKMTGTKGGRTTTRKNSNRGPHKGTSIKTSSTGSTQRSTEKISVRASSTDNTSTPIKKGHASTEDQIAPSKSNVVPASPKKRAQDTTHPSQPKNDDSELVSGWTIQERSSHDVRYEQTPDDPLHSLVFERMHNISTPTEKQHASLDTFLSSVTQPSLHERCIDGGRNSVQDCLPQPSLRERSMDKDQDAKQDCLLSLSPISKDCSIYDLSTQDSFRGSTRESLISSFSHEESVPQSRFFKRDLHTFT